MAKRSIVFIINPISGTQSKDNIIELISQHLDQDKFNYQIARTEYAGHATLLAQEHVEKGCVCGCGYWGRRLRSMEIARSLRTYVRGLGVIPCGSGNGLARHLRIPMDPLGSIKVLNRFDIECLDYGKINDVPFFCTCGVGFDAFVSSKFAHSEKRGVLTYLENTLREGLKYKPDTYEIEIEGENVQV